MKAEERIKTTIESMYEIRFTLSDPKNWDERFKVYQEMLTFASGYKMAAQDLTNLKPNGMHKIVTDMYNTIEKKYE